MADPPITPTSVDDSTNPTGALTSSAKVGDSSHSSLLTINAAPHLPHKLKSNNYPLWRAQLLSFLTGCGLEGFVDGSHPCIPGDRQDQLILSWIFTSVSKGVLPIIVSSSTSKAAWDSLARVFAPSSRSRILHLKERLSNLNRGNDSITTYMQSVKAIADDLAIIGQPLAEEDLILAVLKGLGGVYRDFGTSIRLHAGNLSFADLHGLLLTQELHIADADTVVPEILPPTANNALGHLTPIKVTLIPATVATTALAIIAITTILAITATTILAIIATTILAITATTIVVLTITVSHLPSLVNCATNLVIQPKFVLNDSIMHF